MGLLPGPKASVSVLRLTRTNDNKGGWAETWTVSFTKQAAVRSLSGYETLAGAQQTVFGQYRVLFEYDTQTAGITERNRLRFSGRDWEIVFVANPGLANHHLEVTVRQPYS